MQALPNSCTCYDETTRPYRVCIGYWSKRKGEFRLVTPFSKSQQIKCSHKWRECVKHTGGWRNVYKKCVVKAR